MSTCPPALGSRRAAVHFLALIAVLACSFATPAAAGDILITSGSLTMSPSAGRVVSTVTGDSGSTEA